MARLVVLHHKERVRINPDCLVALYEELGERGAEQVVVRAMCDLNVRLMDLQRLAGNDDPAALIRRVRTLVKVADQIGMTTFARVAADVIVATGTCNKAAQAATLARLQRIGNRSLNAVWDLRFMTV